jgi:hypothetical protein
VKIPNEKLIEDLKRVAKTLDKKPTQAEYSKFGKYSTTTFTNRKPWNKWLMEVFGQTNQTKKFPPANKIDKESLIKNLENIRNRMNRVPKAKDLILGKYTISAYQRVFGTFSNALIACEMKPNRYYFRHKKSI